jgi:hypothetical protein
MSETAAQTAARIFEAQRLQESTSSAIAEACRAVGVVFLDDDARTRAAHAMAEGIPEGITTEAARRLVSLSLRDPAFAPYLKQEPAPGSLDAIKARLDAAKEAGREASAASPAPVVVRRTLEEIGAEIRARRSPILYPNEPKTEPEPEAESAE